MAHHDASALWDWDSVLLLAQPPGDLDSSGVGEHDQQQQEPEQSQQNQQRRRRDPRLSCPNFLAGRVPCACSDEEDEDEEDRTQKRPKVLPRCQVPNCQSELAGLKGYHQRHRVCLTCANATSVFLRSQHQRYCQQCGKFHPLPDFDSGKRSCRRKLEKHNDRRRRSSKLSEAAREASVTQSSDKEAPSNTNTSDGAAAPSTSGGSGLYCFQSHEHRLQNHDQAEAPADNNISCEQEASYVVDASAACDDALLALMLEEQHDERQLENVKQHHHSTPVVEQQQSHRKHACPSLSSSGIKKASTYTSPFPTKRISFKFYDWNPADFPRRLREQILEWLANMPVELEGYIRSGCTILTLYIAMPEPGWIKLYEDWTGHLMKLIAGAEAGFWDKGCVAACFDNKVAYIDHGLVSSPSLKATDKYPLIEAVSPICLEAGKKATVIVTGRNLLELNSRLLVGSEGKYLPRFVRGDTTKVQVELVTPKSFGVAYIEVAHEFGISNFVPLLIADKGLCQEVKTLEFETQLLNFCCCSDEDMEKLQKRQEVSNLIMDLGWAARILQDSSSGQIRSAIDSDSDSHRLQSLLLFAAEKGWTATVERVVEAAARLGLLDRIGLSTAQRVAASQNRLEICKVLEKTHLQNHEVNKVTTTQRRFQSMFGSLKLQLRCRKKNVVRAAVGIAVACAGVCIVLQHPQQVAQISSSLRRCLWYQRT